MHELFKKRIMDREKFNKLFFIEKGSWQKDAEHRRRWRWLNKLTLKPKIKYYILRRKFFTLFMQFVTHRFIKL